MTVIVAAKVPPCVGVPPTLMVVFSTSCSTASMPTGKDACCTTYGPVPSPPIVRLTGPYGAPTEPAGSGDPGVNVMTIGSNVAVSVTSLATGYMQGFDVAQAGSSHVTNFDPA